MCKLKFYVLFCDLSLVTIINRLLLSKINIVVFCSPMDELDRSFDHFIINYMYIAGKELVVESGWD